MQHDLTVGSPDKLLPRFCLPLFASVVFQQLYNLADSFVAGKFIGEAALAAVGNSYEVTLIFIAFGFGCNMGCSVISSRLFGAKRYRDLKTAVSTAMLSTAALCALLMVLGLVFSAPLLTALDTPAEIFADSLLYLNIYLWGLPFLFFYNLSNGIFTALGDSKTPFWMLAGSSLSNIGMDILFVKGFGMGVAGVAWATFLCQGVSGVLVTVLAVRKILSFRTEQRAKFFSVPLLGDMVKIAVPSTIQQSIISVGNLILQNFINGFDTPVIAGYAAGVKLNNLVISAFTTVGNGISSYTAQNVGAGKPERIRPGIKSGVGMVWILSLPLIAVYFLFGNHIATLFMDQPTETAIATAAQYLRILSPFYIIASVKLVSDGALRGAGKMKQFMVCTFTDLVLRVGIAAVLCRTPLGVTGIWMSWPVGWIAGTVVSVLFFRRAFPRNRTAEPSSTQTA